MKALRAVVFALPILAACATGPSLAQRLSVYIGQPEPDLVAALGVPLRIYDEDGRRFLEFDQQRLLAVPAPYAFGAGAGFGYYGWRGGGGYVGSTVVTASCGITFAIRDGRAESFTLRGDGCW
ncbi:hypothetical protein ACQW02_07785 [Humitalea sp. 24SJ18S-53]|uniref:hypothetical protein n=1 Tax=Humitalea sp. 24SJ18S-53 TaxID=3422307 RepID=UPI003D66AD4C